MLHRTRGEEEEEKDKEEEKEREWGVSKIWGQIVLARTFGRFLLRHRHSAWVAEGKTGI